jgi:hypothetical protein
MFRVEEYTTWENNERNSSGCGPIGRSGLQMMGQTFEKNSVAYSSTLTITAAAGFY